MSELSDLVVVVTGAQQGIGRSIAIACAEAGAHVVINYLDDPTAAEEVASCARANARQPCQTALTVQADISQRAEVERLMDATIALGGIDVLINNAAIFPRCDFLAISEADWDGVLGVNLKGAFFCTQVAAQRMIAQKRGGSIVNITSGAAFRGSPQGVHYVASKAGLVGLTRATAQELAGAKIRVNAIAPGLTDTAQPRYGMSEAQIAAAGDSVPLGGINGPDDMAGLTVFLASGDAARITGQTIHVNGGQYLY